eukprot:IDg18289t1
MDVSLSARAACFACGAQQLRISGIAAPSPSRSTWRGRKSTLAPMRRSAPGPTLRNVRDVRADGRAAIVLWFGERSLRLGDCCAVAATASLRGARILPVAVLTAAESMRCARALETLTQQLQIRGSQLVIRIVAATSQKYAVVEQLARQVQARSIFASTVLATCLNRTPSALPVNVTFFPPSLAEPPATLPPPPAVARALYSEQVSTSASAQLLLADGEIRARARLLRAVQTGARASVALQLFARELAVGSLARCRVLSECGVRISVPVGVPRRILCASSSAVGAVGLMNAYDVLDNDRRGVEWDEKTKQFRLKQWEHTA